MKTALVTGASRGIGREIAIELASKGYNIALNYKQNDAEAEVSERLILAHNVSCLKLRYDVGKLEEVEAMHEVILNTLGYTSVIINNAGVAKGGLIQDTSQYDYDYIMNTNLRGVYNVTKTFVPDLLMLGEGRIVNISSIWGEVGGAYESLYSASKAGVIGLTKALAKELAPSNITVNAIAPGAIMTDMLKQLPLETLEHLHEEIPLGRIGIPNDISKIVAMLVDRTCSYMTGQVITISGGY